MSLVAAHGERVLLPQHLPLELRVRLMRGRVASRAEATPLEEPLGGGAPLAATAASLRPWRQHRCQILKNAEREYFTALLALSRGDAAQAAALSGLKSARLYELLGKHGLLRAKRGGEGFPVKPE